MCSFEFVQNRLKFRGQRHWAAGDPIYIDMHKMATGCGQGFSLGKQSHLIPDAGGALVGHANAGLYGLRKSQRGKIVALGFNDQTDRGTVVNVQHALLNQMGVHSGVKPTVIHHVVHVTIGIVVHPAGGDVPENGVNRPGQSLGFERSHGVRFCQRSQYSNATAKVLT